MVCRAGEEIPACEKDRDEICSFTNHKVSDETFLMDVPSYVFLIGKFWLDIVQISRREYRERFENDGKIKKMYYLYTIDMIDSYLNNLDFNILKYNRADIYDSICLFHAHYMAGVI